MSENDKVYTKEMPDPVVANATKYALEVTEPRQPHPWWNRFTTIAIIFVIIVGTFGAVIGTINTISVNKQNNELKAQSACQAQLLKALSDEQKARAGISSDDRAALATLVHAIANAKSNNDIQKALVAFNRQTAINDKKRALYPVPTFNTDVCEINAKDDPRISLTQTNSPGKTPSAAKPTSAVSTSGNGVVPSTRTQSAVAPRAPKAASKASQVQTPRKTHAAVKNAPATTTAPARATQDPVVSVNLPTCTVKLNILGQQVCV